MPVPDERHALLEQLRNNRLTLDRARSAKAYHERERDRIYSQLMCIQYGTIWFEDNDAVQEDIRAIRRSAEENRRSLQRMIAMIAQIEEQCRSLESRLSESES
jgi:hypothetical protein